VFLTQISIREDRSEKSEARSVKREERREKSDERREQGEERRETREEKRENIKEKTNERPEKGKKKGEGKIKGRREHGTSVLFFVSIPLFGINMRRALNLRLKTTPCSFS
jgi:hypothetical protein